MVPSPEAYAELRQQEPVAPATADQSVLDRLFYPGQDLSALFDAVARERDPTVFSDGKKIADSNPLRELSYLSQAYTAASGAHDFNPTRFWLEHFELPRHTLPAPAPGKNNTGLDEYIAGMWGTLTYHVPRDRGSLIGTPNPHLKPGERFGEGYYWDLADAMGGLLVEARSSTGFEQQRKEELALGVLNNIAYQIEKFGYVPNGLRTYYLGRSQPPVFAGIVKEMAGYFQDRKPNIVEDYLPWIVKEYQWWMQGEEAVAAGNGQIARERVVRLPNGGILNRHWDSNDTPRPESYQEDLKTAELASGTDPQVVFRHLRAGAESGRDFTARFLTDPERLETIHTTDFLTPELNSLLWEYENMIAQAHDKAGRSKLAAEFHDRASRRKAAIDAYLWNEADGCYYDYDFVNGEQSRIKSMGTAYPVARGAASLEQGRRVAKVLGADLLKVGGFVSAAIESGQQWDNPNGFPRDQTEGAAALMAAGDSLAAVDAAQRWLKRDSAVYAEYGVLVEKNNVVSLEAQPGSGGEYPVQRGFLWTIGAHRVLQQLLRDSNVC